MLFLFLSSFCLIVFDFWNLFGKQKGRAISAVDSTQNVQQMGIVAGWGWNDENGNHFTSTWGLDALFAFIGEKNVGMKKECPSLHSFISHRKKEKPKWRHSNNNNNKSVDEFQVIAWAQNYTTSKYLWLTEPNVRNISGRPAIESRSTRPNCAPDGRKVEKTPVRYTNRLSRLLSFLTKSFHYRDCRFFSVSTGEYSQLVEILSC